MPASISDYLQRPNAAGLAFVTVGTWVQLVNNVTSTAYVSTSATDATGKFTISNIPAGQYTVNTGPTNTGPWTSTGDTSYIVADQLGWFNVKDFGAKGDGVTDDTTAIQAAETACAVAGGTVFFPPGTYMASGIVKQSNAHWLGAGTGQVYIKLKNSAPTGTSLVTGANFATLTGTNPTVPPWGITGFSIRNLSFDGNILNNGSHAVPLIRWYAYGYVMDGVAISNTNNAGWYSEWTNAASPITLPFGFEAKINNVMILFPGTDGIQWNGPGDSMFNQVEVEGAGHYGIWLQSKGVASVLNSCHCWGGSQQWGIFADSQCYLNNCQAEDGTVGGVWLRANNSQIIGGAYFATPVGIRIGVAATTAVSGTQVRGASIYNCTTAAFGLDDDGGNNGLEFYPTVGSNAANFTGTMAGTTYLRIPPGVAGEQIIGTGSNGANISLIGDGVSTPTKTIRVKAGNLEVRNNAYSTAILSLTDTGSLNVTAGVQPGTPAGASQFGSLWMGSGVPSNSNGQNGDFYFRTDTPGTANQRMYIKSAGAWVALTI